MNNIVLITGPTGAIGKATAYELAKNNCQLILLGRNEEKLKRVKSEITLVTGNNNLDIIIADLSEPESVRQAAGEIREKYSSLNTLMNLAAVFKSKRLENSRGTEYMFATNHLGPFILTTELLELLKAGKPARIVTVSAPSTSKINFDSIIGKNNISSGALSTFGATKMMNLMFTYALAGRLEGTGVTANVLHPGLVISELMNEMPSIMNFIFKRVASEPYKAAKMLCKLAIDDQFENSSGKFYKFDGKEIKSNNYSYNKEIQERLWKVSEELVK